MPTNEHQGKPPEKASYPCHGYAFLRVTYLLIKSAYERATRKPPERTVVLANPSVGYIFVATISSAKNTHFKKNKNTLPKYKVPIQTQTLETYLLKTFKTTYQTKVPPPQTQAQEITKIYKKLSLQTSTFEMWHHRHEAPPTSTKMTVLQSWRYLVDCSVGRSCPELVWIHCLETWVGSLRHSGLLIFLGWFGRAWLGFVWCAHLVWLRLTGNRQKEQVTRKHGCVTLPQLLLPELHTNRPPWLGPAFLP